MDAISSLIFIKIFSFSQHRFCSKFLYLLPFFISTYLRSFPQLSSGLNSVFTFKRGLKNGWPKTWISSVQSLSHGLLFATPWITALQASLSITNSRSLLKLMSIQLVMPPSHLILCHSLLLLPPIPPSIRVFSNESTLRIRWSKYWSFSFSISPSNEQPGLISFRMDWLDLLAVQGTLKSLLQHHHMNRPCKLRLLL